MTHSTTPGSVEEFDNIYSANLVGLWDFLPGGENDDTGLDDGVAQDGSFHGSGAWNGDLYTNGRTYFEVNGTDAPFDLDEGTIMLGFSQSSSSGTDTLVSRGEYNDRYTEGFLDIRVTSDGAVEVQHVSDGTEICVSTSDGVFDEGDDVQVFYTWSDTDGGSLKVVNITDGTEETVDIDANLTMDIGDNDGQSFTLGAREYDDGQYDHGFAGTIDYVAVYDADVLKDGDGVVEGTEGDNRIDLDYDGDPDGDRIDNDDAILPGQSGDDDIVAAGAGDDTVDAGEGDDTVYGGSGDDTLSGGDGDDVLYGDSDYDGESTGREVFQWSEAPDPNGPAPIEDGDSLSHGFTQNTGSVDVTFRVLNSDRGVSNTYDSETQATDGIDGADIDPNSAFSSVLNGDCNDADYQLSFSSEVDNVSFRVNDLDGDGVVKITAYDADGHPVEISLTVGSNLKLTDTDTVTGGDTAQQGHGDNYSDPDDLSNSVLVEIAGPVSSIVISHDQNGNDNSGITITDVYFDATDVDADGDDTLLGDDGNDTLYGEGGDDVLAGGADSDTVHGGDGNDTISGDAGTDGDGADQLFGDYGNDTFVDIGEGDVIDGGEDPDDGDIDVLDLTGVAQTVNPGGSAKVEYDAADPESGSVHFYDRDGDETGTATFTNIEKVVICFTPGTLIATPRGEKPVETLKVGDRAVTRDNGIQEIRWLGQRNLNAGDLARARHLRPVRIRKGALGNDLPERDMMLSPNHRVLVANDRTALYFDESEVLVAAKHLTGMPGVDTVDVTRTSYLHMMFDNHEVVLSDGAWTETFQPGDYSLAGIGNAQRTEIFELFPELQTENGLEDYQAARRALKKHEARVLFS